MARIDETLKKVAAGTSKATSSTTSPNPPDARAGAGDPNCPICGGVGFIRQELPVGHPDFGRIQVCGCRQSEVTLSARQRLYRMSNLESLRDKTFDSFDTRGFVGISDQQALSLNSAFERSQKFAANLNGWLLLTGGPGCGKTHLAAAVANFAASLNVPTLFLTVPDLLDWLRFAYDSHETTFEERFEEIRSVRLLVLDDFGTQNATPWAQEKLFQIFNYRYINRLPLVVTTNLAIDEIEERIRSRLQDSALVDRVLITAPDYRNPREDLAHPELSSLNLHLRQTFASFSLREDEGIPAERLQTLKLALREAKAFADRPSGWLVLQGDYASGKTHLAAAIGLARTVLGETVQFMVVPDLLDHLRATFNPSSNTSYDRTFDQMRNAPLLVLDDLGTQSTTAWAREKLFQLFNYRYNAELPTVITTSLKIDDLDPRLLSRIMDTRLCRIVEIKVPPYRGSEPPKSNRPNLSGRRR